MKTQLEIESSLEYELTKFENAQKNTALLSQSLRKFHAFFYSLDSLRYCYFYPTDALVIVGIRTREDLARIRAMKKGIWIKSDATSYGDWDAVKYTARIDGIAIDVRITELPSSCRVVEEEREVPAHKEIVRRLVCSDPAEQHAQNGKIISVEPATF